MRNRIARFALAIAAVFSLALTGCGEIVGDDPSDRELTPEEILAECGEGCRIVTFYIDLLDEDKRPVKRDEGFAATVTVNAVEASADGTPTNIRAWNSEINGYTMTPFDYDVDIPSENNILLSPNTVEVSLDITASVAAGYTLTCSLKEYAPNPQDIMNDAFENVEGVVPDAEGAMGMPIDGRVFCSWPAGLVIPDQR